MVEEPAELLIDRVPFPERDEVVGDVTPEELGSRGVIAGRGRGRRPGRKHMTLVQACAKVRGEVVPLPRSGRKQLRGPAAGARLRDPSQSSLHRAHHRTREYRVMSFVDASTRR